MVGSGVLGQDVGLTELFPVSPQVMETRQVPRSPRVRLLLLLLLLVPWGDHTASGVALPPAGVLRYVRRPGHPERAGFAEVGIDPKRKGHRDPRERRTETRDGERWSVGRESARGTDTRRF